MLYAVLIAAIAVLFWLSRQDSQQSGKQEKTIEIVEATNEALSDRPLTDSDFVKRLRDLAARKRKD